MKGRSLLALSVLSLALACEGNKLPTGPNAPDDASKIIRDGAHSGGNKDFFFLPPMVPLPLHNPDFQLGKFNNALRPSLKVVICELNNEYNAQHVQILPTDNATCGATKKTFAPGSVQLVNLPLRQNGWWTLFGLPPDGFYYVLWDTRQSNLQLSKYYRIKVFVEGKPDELGIADVDPMGSLREWKYSLTGQVIQLIDDVLLPITFRVEQGALCQTGTTCSSATYTNTTPLEVKVDPEGTGSVAGALIPDGALPSLATDPTCTPARCPQSVVVNITEVPAGALGQGFAAASTICHPDIPQLQQFKGCYNFSTTPELRRLNEAGDQFIKDVLVAVCFELEGTGDAREKFAQLYSSGPEEPSKWLDDVPEGTLIGGLTKDCTPPPPPPPIGQGSSNSLIQFASTGWRTLKEGLSNVFGIKTAYAIDLGLGGLTKGFSHISPVLRVGIAAASSTDLTLAAGQYSTNVSAKIVAEHFHTEVAPGVNAVPVTFTVAEGNNGTIKLVTDEGPGTTAPITVNTAGVALPGIAAVTWTLPNVPGTYTMTAQGPAYGGPITYHATVPVALANPVVAFSGSEVYAASGVFVRFNVPVTNSTDYPAALFAPRPDLPPCGLNTSASRTWVSIHNASNGAPLNTFCGLESPSDLQLIWFATPQGQAPPSDVYVKLTDRATGVTYTSSNVSLASPNPVITFGGSELYSAGGLNFVRYNLPVTNYTAYKPEMFASAPLLPACGLSEGASRTWVDIYNASNDVRLYGFCGLGAPSDLQNIWFSEAAGTPPPSQVYIKLTDRATGVTYQSNNIVLTLPDPVLTYVSADFIGDGGVRYNLAVTNYTAYRAEMFAPAPMLPACGANTSASRTWVDIYEAGTNNYLYGFCALGSPSDLQSIWFAEPGLRLASFQVYIKLTDRATGVVYTSNNVTPLPPP